VCRAEQQTAGSRARRAGGANRSKAGRASRQCRAEQLDGAGQSRAAAPGTVASGTKEAGTAASGTWRQGRLGEVAPQVF
jgi:hypothetical protein